MKIATRAAYGEALAELAEAYPQLVVLDADLSGSTMTKTFAAKYPDRFFDMGIAEGNMAGVAAGLATCGKIPFINSFAMFSAGRAWEQVRNSIAYPGLNVKVIGSHGGLRLILATNQPSRQESTNTKSERDSSRSRLPRTLPKVNSPKIQ